MLFNVRGITGDDVNDLLDIDIKCFDYAWTPAEWSQICKTHAIAVGTYFGTPVGFGVCLRIGTDVELRKVAVKAPYRRRNLGRKLYNACVRFAIENHCTRMFAVVPESLIYPGSECIGSWLRKLGFRAQKPFIKDCFRMYGQSEDGVKFSQLLDRNSA